MRNESVRSGAAGACSNGCGASAPVLGNVQGKGSARFVKVTGPVGSGKSELIVRKAVSLVREGVDAARVCVVAASGDAAAHLRDRIMRDEPGAAGIVATTALGLCVRILSEAGAGAGKRMPRLLVGAERAMLIEDVKAQLGSGGGLRQSMARIAHAEAACTCECLEGFDAQVLGCMRGLLRRRCAMLPEEAPRYAADVLQAASAPFDYLFVDDCQNASVAEQRVFERACAVQLVVAGDMREALSAPGSAAFDRFQETHSPCDVIELRGRDCGPAARFCAALADDGGGCEPQARPASENAAPSSGHDGLSVVKWRDAAAESEGLAVVVARMLKADRDRDLSSIYLAVPNVQWARQAGRALAGHRIASTMVVGKDPLKGDPRVASKAGMFAAYALLALACDEEDAGAWRLWCGLGSPDLACAAWSRLENEADRRGATDAEALRLASTGALSFEGARQLGASYRDGLERARALAQKRSFALAKALSRIGGKPFARLCGSIEGDEDVSALYRRVTGRCLDPRFSESERCVRIGSYEHLAGLNPDLLVLSGMARGLAFKGLSPEDALRSLYGAAGKATERVIVSIPQAVDAQVALRLGLSARRCHVRDGKKLAVLAPVPCLLRAGDELPGSVSGEQLLGAKSSGPSAQTGEQPAA